MTVDTLRIRLDETDPQGWRERWQQAQQHGDSRKIEIIVQQVNRPITEMENRATREARNDLVSDLPAVISWLCQIDNSMRED